MNIWHYTPLIISTASVALSWYNLFKVAKQRDKVWEQSVHWRIKHEQALMERDAAIHDINRCCATCKHFTDDPNGFDCSVGECLDLSGWEWRGLCAENMREDSNDDRLP